MKKPFSLIIYYFLVIIYFEICYKFLIFGSIFDNGFLYICLFSFLISIFLTFFSRLSSAKINRKIVLLILIVLTIMFSGNFIYYRLFSVPFTFQITSMAGQAMQFINVIFKTIWDNFFSLLLFFLPITWFLWKQNKIIITKIYYFEKKSLILFFTAVYILTTLLLFPFKNRDYSPYRLYWKQNNLNASIKTFGLLTSARLDLQRLIFGFEEKIQLTKNDIIENERYQYNKMNIDFTKLKEEEKDSSLKTIYSYFQNESPTKKNAFTGMYEGKNLIFILAESFNSIAVSKELTPTLYKLTHTGFQFNNYYSPIFLSTTGGEFQAMTGLVPSADTLNEWYKGKVSLPFSLGNSFKDLGYSTNAFHDYEATFYNRTETMPTLGFDNYFACLNGMEKEINCEWVNSNAPDDEEMIEITFPKYQEQEKFMTYYITMSGHFPYILSEKTRNYEKVKDLPYSDESKAYLATQIDLDQAVELLIKKLAEQGILDDTVICLVGDHYPYGLSMEQINEISTYKRDEQFEIHRSNLFIWNNDTKPIAVDKVGSQIDILPTLLNLFGIEYDSRLLIGHDLLSDVEGLAIFSDMSWISDSGIYNATTKTFLPKKEVKDNYVTEKNRWVNNSVTISKKIISNDIYRKIISK